MTTTGAFADSMRAAVGRGGACTEQSLQDPMVSPAVCDRRENCCNFLGCLAVGECPVCQSLPHWHRTRHPLLEELAQHLVRDLDRFEVSPRLRMSVLPDAKFWQQEARQDQILPKIHINGAASNNIS